MPPVLNCSGCGFCENAISDRAYEKYAACQINKQTWDKGPGRADGKAEKPAKRRTGGSLNPEPVKIAFVGAQLDKVGLSLIVAKNEAK